MAAYLLVVAFLGVVTAVPAPPTVLKLDSPRYQYEDVGGQLKLVDLWVSTNDLKDAARYSPDGQNVYHLFTRQNPSVSQPMFINTIDLFAQSNYDPARRTILIIHGWQQNAVADVNSVLVPAFLEAEDVNVFVVDWAVGANPNYATAVLNTVTSGEGVARFVRWVIQTTGASFADFHLVGLGLGGHQVGIIGRNLGGQVAYITALDPSLPGWLTNTNKFSSTDGEYTEVIHTNAGDMGYLANLGDVDFYPNGGVGMPGCVSQQCDHARSFYYFAESIVSGGFTGQRCASYITAMAETCYLESNLQMGGLKPKTGSSGIFHLRTWPSPPFSRD